MDPNSLLALKNIISPDNDDEEQQDLPRGSIFSPADVGTNKSTDKDDKHVSAAKPYAQIEAKVNKPKLDQNRQIWQDNEVQEINVPKQDDRQVPDYDIKFKQFVGTNDVYLGLGDMDPTTTKCQNLIMKITLPATQFKEIQLDVTTQNVIVQSPNYFLNHTLPYPVNSKEGKAKWISDKFILELDLPIVRQDLF